MRGYVRVGLILLVTSALDAVKVGSADRIVGGSREK